MKRPVRTILFLVFVSLFLVTAPGIIVYSQGYRVDWARRTLIQTGALSLEPRPAPVELRLDYTVKKRSNFVFQNIVVGNLVPGIYHVEIRKEGYHSWQKNLSVAPKLITEAKNILLFPESPPTFELARNVETFSLSPTLQYIAVVRAPDAQDIDIIPMGGNETVSTLRMPNNFANYRIAHIEWNKNATKLLLRLELKNSRAGSKWVIFDVWASRPNIDDLSLISSAQVTQPRWNSGNSSEILFVARDSKTNVASFQLFSYNADTKTLSSPLAHDVLLYTIQGDKILYISSKLFTLNSLDRLNGEIRQIAYYPLFFIEKDPEAMFLNLPQIAIQANHAVYLFVPHAKIFKKVADNVLDAIPSYDAKKLLIQRENSLSVYWLKDTHVQPFHDAGEQEEVWRDFHTLNDVAWVGKADAHLILASNNSIYTTELDGRDTRNTQKLIEKAASKIQYNETQKNLYFLSENTLYSLSLE